MATRTATKIKQAFEQYSKKMATRVTIFWMIYRLGIAILIFFRPEIGTTMIHLTEGVDTVMIVNMSVYTGNSATEKVAIAFGKRDIRYDKLKSSDDADEDEDEDPDSNG